MWRLDTIGIPDLFSLDPATHPELHQINGQIIKKQNGDGVSVYAGVVFSEAPTLSDACCCPRFYSILLRNEENSGKKQMVNLTKANLVEALHQRGVSVPSGSPKKELIVKLYWQHVLNDGRFPSGDHSSDEDRPRYLQQHDDSYTLPEVSDSITSLSDDALLAKHRDLGFQAGPVVTSTRSLFERQLQQLLNNSSVPTTPSVPTNELSATEEYEEEEPQVIPEDNSDEEDGPFCRGLQGEPTTIFLLRAQSVRFNLSNSNSHGVNEAVQPSRRWFTYSTRSSSLPQAGSPVQVTQRSRAGTRREDMAGRRAATTPAVGKQRRISMVVKVLIVLTVITVNVLTYVRTPVEQGSQKKTLDPNRKIRRH
ncbi:lamina-associated polypeptide 2, isoforms beta/delta/epsilon/gamma-like [Ixodes scapularis]